MYQNTVTIQKATFWQAGKRGLAAFAGALILGIASCKSPPPTIAVIPRTCGTWLWEAEHTGAARTAPRYGLLVYWTAPMRDDDVQGQIQILDQCLKRKVSGVIVSPIEALPLRTPVQNALDAGAPVVVVGTDLGLTPGKKLAYVLNDEKLGGQMAAQRVGARLGGKGDIAILGISPQLTSTVERERSLERTLADQFPGIRVVFRSLALPTVSQEQQVAEKLLVDGEHVDAIVALTEASTRGAFYALTEFNRTLATPLIGFDQNILAPIRTGEIDSVIVQNTFQMGQDAMTLMAQEISGSNHAQYVVVPPQLVTRDTIDSAPVTQTLDLAWFKP
jgi:ribose transport system substrate-binding protein